MKKSLNQLDLTSGPVFLMLVRFAVPIILSSILQLLFNAADIIVVGRFAGENSLAAVGSTGSLINLLVNLFIGLSVGTNVVAANYFGAGNRKRLSDTVHTAMLLSVYSGLALTVTGVAGARQILELMQVPDEVLELSALYLKIFFGGIIAQMVYNFGSALLRAKGDTKRPLYILFAAGVINVILNLIFVVFLKMDVAGVAVATIISQSFSAVCVVYMLVKETDGFRLEFCRLKIDREIFINIIRIGVPAGIQGTIFSFSNVIIQSSVNGFGAMVIAGNAAAQNIEGFVYVAMNGISSGTLTFASQNMGACRYDRIKHLCVVSQIFVIITGLVLGNSAVFFGRPLLHLYTSQEAAVEAGLIRLKVICGTYALCGMMDCMGSLLRGIGHSLLPMVISLIGACGLRLIWIATVFQISEYHSTFTIFVSYPVSWFITFIALTAGFLRYSDFRNR